MSRMLHSLLSRVQNTSVSPNFINCAYEFCAVLINRIASSLLTCLAVALAEAGDFQIKLWSVSEHSRRQVLDLSSRNLISLSAELENFAVLNSGVYQISVWKLLRISKWSKLLA